MGIKFYYNLLLNLSKNIYQIMGFNVKIEQLVALFNPDFIHRGISLQKLKKLGKIQTLQSLIKTNFKKGLLNDCNQHKQRRQYFGSNEPYLKKQIKLRNVVAKHFEDELVKLMIVAGLISLVLGVLTEGFQWGWIQGFSILVAVTLYIGISSINQFANEKSFELIKGKQEQTLVRVYRGGRLYLLKTKDLMVGDIIQIMGGDKMNVDGILISGEDIMVDQSQITGQAIQIKKQVPLSYERQEGKDPFIISGSRVMSGIGIMIVLAVGEYSYYGNLMAKINEEHLDSPLKVKLRNLSNQMNDSGQLVGIITFSSLICHYIYWCFQDDNPIQSIFSERTLHKLFESILITFTIDVALPESLPLLVTIALSVTANKLQQRNIFVKHLIQCQTMGSIDNLCLSKTGFVSKNILQVSEIFVEERITNIISQQIMSQNTCRLLNLAIVMNSIASPKFIKEKGETIRIQHMENKAQCALLEMSYRMGYNYQRFRLNSKIKRIYSTTLPKKKMATVYKDEGGKLYLFVKGSPKYLLSYCSYHINRYDQVQAINTETNAKIQNAIEYFAKTNHKIVIIAYKDMNTLPTKWSQVQKNLILIAIIGIKDFIRHGVKKTIQQCQQLGINVRMLTSQNKSNAICAAKQTGILGQNWTENNQKYTIIQGTDFRQLVSALAKPDKENFDRTLALQNFKLIKESLKIIYRASAEDKLLLAIGLKQCGHIVAVAGNGTNDTQALRKADVSISMGRTCNETAKEASDIVILDDNFSSILKTVLWGRHTMNTIKKFLALQLTINIVAAFMALLGAVFVGQSPLNPIQMLWINLVIDLFGSISLIIEAPLSQQINRVPYNRNDKIVSQILLKPMIVQCGIQVLVLSWILFYGPNVFGVVSSIGVEQQDVYTDKHQSIFFNTFVLLQIFNQLNVRVLNFEQINIFQGLSSKPLFLCFFITSLILQFLIIRYGSGFLHITQLSFRQNVLCLILASLSITGNLCYKIYIPNNFLLFHKDNSKQAQKDQQEHLSEAQLQALSPQLNVYLTKRRTLYKYSYIEQKDTIQDSFNFEEESLTESQNQHKFR